MRNTLLAAGALALAIVTAESRRELFESGPGSAPPSVNTVRNTPSASTGNAVRTSIPAHVAHPYRTAPVARASSVDTPGTREDASPAMALSASGIVQVGQVQEMRVHVASLRNIRRVAFTLRFDAEALEMVDAGDAPTANAMRPRHPAPASASEAAPREEEITWYGELSGDQRANADGIIAVLQFRTLQAGTALVEVFQAEMTDTADNPVRISALPFIEMHVESGPI